MKEYQAARKKLETRRLAYDATLAKLQKAKREDFRVEEELRSQKAKYEEAEDDVHRRMEEIRDMDPESVADLGAFMDAQLTYHEKCREAMLLLKAEWPVKYEAVMLMTNHELTGLSTSSLARGTRSNPRSRSNTGRSQMAIYEEETPPAMPELRPTIRSTRLPTNDRIAQMATSDAASSRPQFGRSTTYDIPAQSRRDMSPIGSRPLSRVPSDSLMVSAARSNLRRTEPSQYQDIFADDSSPYSQNSPDNYYGDQSVSPSTSVGSAGAPVAKRAPPPPPPSRAKKPPPPPVPQKRTVYA